MKKYRFVGAAILAFYTLVSSEQARATDEFQSLLESMVQVIQTDPVREKSGQSYYEITQFVRRAADEIENTNDLKELGWMHYNLHRLRDRVDTTLSHSRTQWIKDRTYFLQDLAGLKILKAVSDSRVPPEQMLEILIPRIAEMGGNFSLQNKVFKTLQKLVHDLAPNSTQDQVEGAAGDSNRNLRERLFLDGTIRLARVSKGNIQLQNQLLQIWETWGEGYQAEKEALFKALAWQSGGCVDLQQFIVSKIAAGEISGQEKWALAKGLVAHSRGNFSLQNELFQFLTRANADLSPLQRLFAVFEDIIELARQSGGNLELQRSLLEYAKSLPTPEYSFPILWALMRESDSSSGLSH